MSIFDSVLKRPIVTEKASSLRENNQFVLEVKASANKNQIREDIETHFKVNVLSIQTSKKRGKFRRRTGPKGGYQPTTKKAVVTLKQGQQITWDEAK